MFLNSNSTVAALLEATDSGNSNAAVFLDLKKTLIIVDHDILLVKLNLYGIQGVAYNWFE